MAFQKDARLECHKTDRYGRQVCKVWVQPGDCPSCGLTLDVGHAQVIAGMAWWYREYAKEQTAEDQGRYESAENEARLRRWGLWSDPQPVPPWDWRRREWENRQPAIGLLTLYRSQMVWRRRPSRLAAGAAGALTE